KQFQVLYMFARAAERLSLDVLHGCGIDFKAVTSHRTPKLALTTADGDVVPDLEHVLPFCAGICSMQRALRESRRRLHFSTSVVRPAHGDALSVCSRTRFPHRDQAGARILPLAEPFGTPHSAGPIVRCAS